MARENKGYQEKPLGNERLKAYIEKLAIVIGDKSLTGPAIGKIEGQKLLVVSSYSLMPSATSFELRRVPDSSILTPHIVVDEKKVINGSIKNAADLVRTLSIVEQYPLNGFQRRLKDVYADALGVQADWLNKTGTDVIPLDPRGQKKEDLIRKLLGDERYYSDVGFEDWQRAIDNFWQIGQDIAIFDALNKLRESTMSFIAKRNECGGLAGKRLSGLSEDEIARETANKMVLSSLYSGIKLN